MTRHDITPVVDEIDGWHGDDHYTGPRPIPSRSPLEGLMRAINASFRRLVFWMVLLVAALAVLVGVSRANDLKRDIRAQRAETAKVVEVTNHLVAHGAPVGRALSVARLVLDEAARQQVDPALVASIMTVENPVLKSAARSSAGATGLMQVMPFWRRDRVAQRTCGGSDLTDDRVNICFGIHVLKFTMRSRRTLPGALLYYNGCRSSSAPCGVYSRRVLRRHGPLSAALDSVRLAFAE